MKHEKNKIIYNFFKAIIGFFIIIIFRPKMEGINNVPKYGPVVLAGNHKSYIDPLLVCLSTKRWVHFLAKKELYNSPIGFFFKLVGTLPVDRSIHDKNVKNKAIDELKKGKVIGIFPEGTRNLSDNVILPFKYGAVSIAQKASCNIIPFIIVGNCKPFSKDLKIIFFKKIDVSNMTLEKANKLLENTISKNLIKYKKNT